MKRQPKPTPKTLPASLFRAASTGNLKLLRTSLSAGADPNQRPTGKPTLLIAAATAGHLPVVRELLSIGAAPNFAHGGKQGTTALLEAVRNQHFDVARALLSAGADVHFGNDAASNAAAKLCNDLFKSPKSGAQSRSRACLGLLRELLTAGGKVRPGPFRDAAAFGNIGLVRLLLEFGTDVNELDDGNSALDGAVRFRQEDIAVELLQRGADPWIDEPVFGFAPILHQSVVWGLTKLVRGIIAAKADLDRTADVPIGDAPPMTMHEDKDARGNVVGRSWESNPRPMARDATALIVAVRVGRIEMVRLLAQGGADLEATDAEGFTALAWALKLKKPQMAKMLRDAGAKEPTHLRGSSRHALLTAATAGDPEGVRTALADGADANEIHESSREAFTPLMKAAEAGHVVVVNLLLEAGADPNRSGRDSGWNAGLTPLMLAARNGHVPVVKRLLEAGAQIEVQQVNVVSSVFGPKSERSRPDNAAIHEAAAAGHNEIVQLLLAAGANPQDKSGASGTVLEAAAASGNKATLETVLAAKSKPGRKTPVKIDALVRAVESGDQASVRLLLAAGGDANGHTRRNETPLLSAVIKGDTPMVRLLMDAGAKPAADLLKNAPMNELMHAASGGYADIVQLLLAAGAKINDQASDRDTALHFAVTSGHAEVVDVLLKAGASTTLRDDEGHTPLQLARQIISVWTGKNRHPFAKLKNLAGYKHCVKLLEQAHR